LLAERSPTPIATGEIEATRCGFAQFVNQHAAHILQPDACVAGGISEWRRIAALAAAHDLPVAPHWHADLHVQLAAATPNCTTVEYFPLSEGIYPGIGIELDWEAVSHHAIAATAGQR
jgi:L-alanine-DL-glutamate epimerase-like enolase superfamily enzyme